MVTVKNEGPDEFAGVVTVHDEPSAGGAAPLFAAPWACVPAGGGFDCSLDLSAAPLGAGESRPLNMAMMVPVGRQICEIGNQASIKVPVGGSDANSNAGNDATALVTQEVPSPECNPPQAPQSNLIITKTGIGCELGGNANLTAVLAQPSGVICSYQVTVTNAGPGNVNEAVTFFDAPSVAGLTAIAPAGGQPGWVCAAPGPMTACTNGAGMPAGATATFNVQVATTRAAVRASQCRVVNQAWISQPVGAPLNGIAADDVATAVANGPVNICTDVQDQKIDMCPTERQMPDQGCCPEGQRWNGQSCSGGITKPVCPSGTSGTYPNCKTVTKPVCPSGTTGKYPNCKTVTKPVCPSGTTGKYPNCKKITVRYCPSDSVGTYPNCVCRKGTYGEPGNCRQKQCPKGTVGKWPNCETIVRDCPKGSVGTWPNCTKPNPRCPKGTSGKWPNCVTNVCPKGTYGEWPNCYKPGGTNNKTPGTNNRTPNTNCPDGYVYSEKVKTCVRKKNQKRKQQEQPQQQEPLLQAPTYKIDPNRLQQQ